MPDTTIDTLTIKVQGDGQSAVETLDKVANALEKIKSVSVGNTGNVTKRLNSLRDSINSINSKSLSKLNSLFNAINNIKQAAIPKSLIERISEVGRAVKSLEGVDFTQLNRMADGLKALSKVQNVKLPNLKSKNAQAILNTLGSAEAFSGNVESPVSKVAFEEANKFSGVLSDVKNKIKGIAEKAVDVGKNVKSAFSNTIIGRFASKLGETLRAFKRIAIYRLMRSIIREITEGFKTGIDNMYQYSKTFNGEYARNMDTLASANLTFKNSLGAIIAPLINLVTPWLDKFITKLYEINNMIAMVIAGLTGKSTYSKAVRAATEYAAAANNASKSTSKVKEKVDELKRSLAGIDEITIIGDLPSSPTADTGIADTAKNSNVPDYSTMFVETPVDMEKVSKVKDILDKVLNLVKLIGLALLAWNIAKFLGELGLLKGALSKLTFAAGLTLSIVGITLIWDSIKKVVNEGLNWDNFWELALGGSLLTGGATLLGYSFGKKFGARIGFSIGLVLTGLAIDSAAIIDIVNNGVTWDNLFILLLGNGAILGGATYLGKQFGHPKLGFRLGLAITGITLEFATMTDIFKKAEEESDKTLTDLENTWEFSTGAMKDIALGALSGASLGSAILPGWGTLIGAMVGMVVSSVSIIIANWDRLVEYLTFGWTGFTIMLTEKWAQTTNKIIIYWALLWTYAERTWNDFWSKIDSSWKIAQATWAQICSSIPRFWEIAWLYAGKVWSDFWGSISKGWVTARVSWEYVCSKFSESWIKSWTLIKVMALSIINTIISNFELGLNNVIRVVNWFIDRANSVLEWVSSFTGQKYNLISRFENVSIQKISFAEGGFPEDGFFFANHNELVGQFSNGKTAVANNGQIVEGISEGVSSANEEQNSLLREQNRLLRLLLEKRSTIDVTTITNAMSRKNQRDGRVTVPVAT